MLLELVRVKAWLRRTALWSMLGQQPWLTGGVCSCGCTAGVETGDTTSASSEGAAGAVVASCSPAMTGAGGLPAVRQPWAAGGGEADGQICARRAVAVAGQAMGASFFRRTAPSAPSNWPTRQASRNIRCHPCLLPPPSRSACSPRAAADRARPHLPRAWPPLPCTTTTATCPSASGADAGPPATLQHGSRSWHGPTASSSCGATLPCPDNARTPTVTFVCRRPRWPSSHSLPSPPHRP